MMLFLLIVVFPQFRRVQKLTDNINAVTRENLTGVRVVRACNAEAYQEEKFAAANEGAHQNAGCSLPAPWRCSRR